MIKKLTCNDIPTYECQENICSECRVKIAFPKFTKDDSTQTNIPIEVSYSRMVDLLMMIQGRVEIGVNGGFGELADLGDWFKEVGLPRIKEELASEQTDGTQD